jgi:hypothetical protein
MAFTFRPEEKREKILEELCVELEMNSKSKALLWLIVNYHPVKKERDNFFQKMNSQEKEIIAVKMRFVENWKLRDG